MAKFVGRPMSRSYGQMDSSGLSHVERDSISSYISHSRDNGQSGQGHKVTLDSEVQSLMRAGVSESTARQLIGNLKGERDNPGVSTLALALPNPGGVGVRPPNLDEIRRNGMEDKMGKRKLSQAQKSALARGRAALQEMRDNITKGRLESLRKQEAKTGRRLAFGLDETLYTVGSGDNQKAITFKDLSTKRLDKAKKRDAKSEVEVDLRLPPKYEGRGENRKEVKPPLVVREVVYEDADGNTVTAKAGFTVDKATKQETFYGFYDEGKKSAFKADAPAGLVTGERLKTKRATSIGRLRQVTANPTEYVILRKERFVPSRITESAEPKYTYVDKKPEDTAYLTKRLAALQGKVAEIEARYQKISEDQIEAIRAVNPAAAEVFKKANDAALARKAKGKDNKKALENLQKQINAVKEALEADQIRSTMTAEAAEKRATRRKPKPRMTIAKQNAASITKLSNITGIPEAEIKKRLRDANPLASAAGQQILLEAQLNELRAKQAQRDNGFLSDRDNGYHMGRHNGFLDTGRDNITLKSGLYGVASFVGGTAAGVVVTNGVHHLASRVGLKAETADYVTKGVGALLAIDLFLSMRDNRGYLFHRIEDRGVRIGLAAGLILPMIARNFVGGMLDKYEFGKKINTFLLPGSSNSVAGVGAGDAKKAAAAVAPASGFGSIYDLAFDEVELPTSGVGVDVNEAVAGMGRYVTGAEGVGRYVTGAEGVGRYVTGTSGLGVNVSEAVAGMGVNVSEALAGSKPSFRTGGTVFRDGLRGLGADEAFDILSELESFDDLSDDDQYMEGVGAVSRGEKAVYASAADAQKIKSALATAGREVALTFLRPSNVRPNTYIVIVSRPGAESAKQALSQMTRVPSSEPIPPTTLPNAIMTRGVFGKPLFPVTT